MSKSDNTPKRNLQRRPSLGELMKLANNESTPNVVEDSSEADAIQTIDTVAEVGTKGIELGLLGKKIHDEFPTFNAKEFGYATLSKFIYGIKDLKVESSGNSSMTVYIR